MSTISRRKLLALSLAVAIVGCNRSADRPPDVIPGGGQLSVQPSQSARSDSESVDIQGSSAGAAATPEEALRTFFIAMVSKDEATLREVTLPTDEFEWLLRGESLPTEAIAFAKAELAKKQVRSLKPGEEFTLPDNQTITMGPDLVNANSAQLVLDGSPVPNAVLLVDGEWRVDAGPIIAARKAAVRARNSPREN